MPPVEIVKKVYSGGNAGEEVEEKVCEHDHVGLDADNRSTPSHEGLDYVFS